MVDAREISRSASKFVSLKFVPSTTRRRSQSESSQSERFQDFSVHNSVLCCGRKIYCGGKKSGFMSIRVTASEKSHVTKLEFSAFKFISLEFTVFSGGPEAKPSKSSGFRFSAMRNHGFRSDPKIYFREKKCLCLSRSTKLES